MMKTNFDIGGRIREIRQQRAYSQEQLALRAGITTAYLGMIERGEKNPTVAIVERICAAMYISLSDFFAPHKISDRNIDETDGQILVELEGKTPEEKKIILGIIRQALKLRNR